MKFILAIALFALFTSAFAGVKVAGSVGEVSSFLQGKQDSVAALFFVDSSLSDGSEDGLWTSVVSSVSHIFSGEDESTSVDGNKVTELEQKISQDADLLQIDVSKDELRAIQETYDVTTVPFLIVFKKGVIVLKEVPTHETHDKVLQLLNVNPAGVHMDESKKVAVEDTTSSVSAPEPVHVVRSGPVSRQSRHQPAHVARQSRHQPAPVARHSRQVSAAQVDPQTRSQPAARQSTPVSPPAPITKPVAAGKPITLAPGEKEVVVQEAPVQAPVPAPVVDREFIHERCNDVTTLDDEERQYWRSSPYYIDELEDWQLPEDWLLNGYTPINDTTSDEYAIHYSRDEQVFEDVNITSTTSDPRFIAPVEQRKAPIVERPIPQRSAPVIQAPVDLRKAPVVQAPVPQRKAPVVQAPVPQRRAPFSQHRSAPVVQAPVSQRKAPVSQRRAPIPQRRASVSQRKAPVSQRRAPFVQAPVPQRRAPVVQAPVSQRRAQFSQRRSAPVVQTPVPQRSSLVYQAPVSQ
jgi:hypothetical protein